MLASLAYKPADEREYLLRVLTLFDHLDSMQVAQKFFNYEEAVARAVVRLVLNHPLHIGMEMSDGLFLVQTTEVRLPQFRLDTDIAALWSIPRFKGAPRRRCDALSGPCSAHVRA